MMYIRAEGVIKSGWPVCCEAEMSCPSREEQDEYREAIDLLLDDEANEKVKQHA